MQRYDVAHIDDRAVCNDGSPGVYYYRFGRPLESTRHDQTSCTCTQTPVRQIGCMETHSICTLSPHSLSLQEAPEWPCIAFAVKYVANRAPKQLYADEFPVHASSTSRQHLICMHAAGG